MRVAKFDHFSDEELFRQLQEGSEQAYYALFARYWETMYRLAHSLLREEERSKDFLQDIWLSVWEKREKIGNDNIRAYLLQAVRFRVYRHWRDHKLSREHEDFLEQLPSPDHPDEIQDQQELEQHLLQAIEGLPTKCREVFTLSRMEQLSNSEIAEKLQLSKRTVETHISNAIKHLRQKMPVLLFLVL